MPWPSAAAGSTRGGRISPVVDRSARCGENFPVRAFPGTGARRDPNVVSLTGRTSSMSLTSQVEKWVDEVAALTGPAKIVWADGSKAEYDRLVDDMLRDGTLLPLNSRTYPTCYLHRRHPSDAPLTLHLP